MARELRQTMNPWMEVAPSLGRGGGSGKGKGVRVGWGGN